MLQFDAAAIKGVASDFVPWIFLRDADTWLTGTAISAETIKAPHVNRLP